MLRSGHRHGEAKNHRLAFLLDVDGVNELVGCSDRNFVVLLV